MSDSYHMLSVKENQSLMTRIDGHDVFQSLIINVAGSSRHAMRVRADFFTKACLGGTVVISHAARNSMKGRRRPTSSVDFEPS